VLEGMVEKTIVIKNRLGLHARAAVKFVNMANRYGSSVKIIGDETEIDGKSILGILTLAAIQGTSIILRISGKDENDALKALEELIKDKFGERE
jgi:phosphocarrier protein HPr